jgi:hypothetical protein
MRLVQNDQDLGDSDWQLVLHVFMHVQLVLCMKKCSL